MTKREKLIVSAYTGVLMTDFDDFHQFVEEVLKRPVWIHEMANRVFYDELQKAVHQEFMVICDQEDPPTVKEL